MPRKKTVSDAKFKKLQKRDKRRAYQLKKYGPPCTCSGYHFPHRRGSGRCIHHPDGERRQWEHFTGTSFDTGEPL